MALDPSVHEDQNTRSSILRENHNPEMRDLAQNETPLEIPVEGGAS
jgi:hypothetical protein